METSLFCAFRGGGIQPRHECDRNRLAPARATHSIIAFPASSLLLEPERALSADAAAETRIRQSELEKKTERQRAERQNRRHHGHTLHQMLPITAGNPSAMTWKGPGAAQYPPRTEQ